jgi:DNA-binding NarL/FixJ family response regulator
MQTIRILLIEDHAVVRAGLRLLLESRRNFAVVGEATNRADALALVQRQQPHVILLDLDLGAEDGLDLLPALRAAAGAARVLILTGVRNADEHRQAIRYGAVGVVLKEQAPEVLIKAIEKVYAGEVWLDRSMLAQVLDEMVSGAATPASTRADRLATLTEREREVLALVNQGLKNKRISDRLSITETTVRHHLTSIFSKLGVESRLELAIFSQRHSPGRSDR